MLFSKKTTRFFQVENQIFSKHFKKLAAYVTLNIIPTLTLIITFSKSVLMQGTCFLILQVLLKRQIKCILLIIIKRRNYALAEQLPVMSVSVAQYLLDSINPTHDNPFLISCKIAQYLSKHGLRIEL